jgi:hypothetical protein
LLTRSIDLYQDDFTTEEKIFRAAKRVCAIFAVTALTLSVLDLMNIRSVEAAAEFIHNNRDKIADLPGTITTEIRRMASLPPSDSDSLSASVVVAIPRSQAAAASAAVMKTSPVAELADVHHQDAVEFAMASPMSLEKSEPRATANPQPMRLANADPAALPLPEVPTTPVSLAMPEIAIIPLDMVPMPRPAPGPPPPSPAQLLHLEGKDYAKAERCLANAVYFESRSEPIRGQMAVAQVVINRVFSGFYPNDVCGVVYQNAERHLSCQFTFACDGKRKLITEHGAWARANRIAKETLNGQIYVPEVAKSTHYHAIYVHPNWVHEMKKMVRYGIHNFYRPWAWGNGADEPVWGSGAMASKEKK